LVALAKGTLSPAVAQVIGRPRGRTTPFIS
jgi:hypothetical protein